MTIYDAGWELFSKTGDINCYLLYKSGEKRAAGSEKEDGEHKNPRAYNKGLGLRGE